MDIEGKRIIITGAASGIGKALLEALSNFQTQILAVDIDKAQLLKVVGQLGLRPAVIYPISGDLSQSRVVDRVFKHAFSSMKGVDIFIANAGKPYYERTRKLDWQHIAEIFKLNVFSTIYAYQKLREMKDTHEIRFVMVSSAMAHLAMPGYALYSATKAALHRFAEAAWLELERPEELMVVYPIATRTGFFQAASDDTPLPWPSQSAKLVAKKIIQAIKRNRTKVFPSLIFSIIMFLDRFQPLIRRLYQRYYLRDLLK